jgi:hypothetical protein
MMELRISRLLVGLAAAAGALFWIAVLAGTASAATGTSSSVREVGVHVYTGVGGTIAPSSGGAQNVEVFQGLRITTTNGQATTFLGTQVCVHTDGTGTGNPIAGTGNITFTDYEGCSRVPDSHFMLRPSRSNAAAVLTPSQVALQRCFSANYAPAVCTPYRSVVVSIRFTGLTSVVDNNHDSYTDPSSGCVSTQADDALSYSPPNGVTATNPYVVIDGQVLEGDVSDGFVVAGSTFNGTKCPPGQ